MYFPCCARDLFPAGPLLFCAQILGDLTRLAIHIHIKTNWESSFGGESSYLLHSYWSLLYYSHRLCSVTWVLISRPFKSKGTNHAIKEGNKLDGSSSSGGDFYNNRVYGGRNS